MIHKCFVQVQIRAPALQYPRCYWRCVIQPHTAHTGKWQRPWKEKKECEYSDLQEYQKLLWSVLCGWVEWSDTVKTVIIVICGDDLLRHDNSAAVVWLWISTLIEHKMWALLSQLKVKKIPTCLMALDSSHSALLIFRLSENNFLCCMKIGFYRSQRHGNAFTQLYFSWETYRDL